MSQDNETKRKRKRWASWERELIRELYSICTYAQMAEYLKVTPQQVHYEAKKMKLDPNKRPKILPAMNKAELDKQVASYIDVAIRKYSNPKYCKSQTLCWDCVKADGGSDCEWANGKFRPVKGWNATPTQIRNKHKGKIRYVPSFIVHECPKFEPDPPRIHIKNKV